jgi:hypothetical protein
MSEEENDVLWKWFAVTALLRRKLCQCKYCLSSIYSKKVTSVSTKGKIC